MLYIGIGAQCNTDIVIDYGTEQDERKKSPIPPTIKHITGNKNEEVLHLDISVCNEPVEYKYNWEEYSKI